MKQFKNKIAVKGSKALLRAFAAELDSLEYKLVGKTIDNYIGYKGPCTPLFITTNTKHVCTKVGEYTFAMNEGGGDTWLTLPDDYNKAIRLASEVEKDVLEKELLEECKRRFPIGSKFIPAYIENKEPYNYNYCIITNNNFRIEKDNIYALTDDDKIYASHTNARYGNNCYNRLVKNGNKWATIIEDKFKNGDYVVILNNNNGANLPINSVQIIRNFQYIHTNKTWIEIESSIPSRYYKGDGDIRKATPEEIKNSLIEIFNSK